MSPAPRRGGRRPGPPPVDPRQQHLDWLSLIEVTGPFLTVPVLRAAWPTLDALEGPTRKALRTAHAAWQLAPTDLPAQRTWITWVLGELLQWGDALESDPGELTRLTVDGSTPDFALVDPGELVKPDTTRLIGVVCPPGTAPTRAHRSGDEEPAAAPTDQVARLCRAHGVELGLATDGRWWTLVWAPIGGVTTTATFDAATWPEQADQPVVRALRSLLRRSRFFAVADEDMLVPLLRRSLDSQEEVTEALGVQVRQAVELLVEAVGRAEAHGDDDILDGADAHDVYRGAVAVMMRVVFLLFAEERGLLPADNDLYAQAYSASRLHDDLRTSADHSSEEELETSHAAWLRLLGLFTAVYAGVEHPRLRLPAYDGSIFAPQRHPWLERARIDDRTVLHMLKSVQRVVIKGEERKLSFRALDVEQIGYVYEGLLSFEGRRAVTTTVGLIGKPGLEEEVTLTDLEAHAAAAPEPAALAAGLAQAYKPSGIGTPAALARKLTPPANGARAEVLRRLLAATGNDLPLAERLVPFAGIIRPDLRGLPIVITTGGLYVTESRLRGNTGTHYTPRKLAEQVVQGALEPLVHSPGPLQTADTAKWRPRSSAEILGLKVADIAMGSGAFLVAACRYLADHLVRAWGREGRTDGRLIQDDGYGAHAIHDTEADPLTIEARRAVIEHCLYGVDINPMAVEMAKLSLWLVSMDPHRPFTFLDDRLATGDSLLGITALDQVEYMHLDPKAGRTLHEEGALVDFTAGIRKRVGEAAQTRRQLRELPGRTLAELATKRQILGNADLEVGPARTAATLLVAATLAGCQKGIGSRDPKARDDEAEERESSRTGLLLEAARLASDASRGFSLDGEDVRATVDRKSGQWLRTDQPRDGLDREPLHWPLVFPEVFDGTAPGFDAIIGNPPFLGGQKITGVSGEAYREYLVEQLGRAQRGSADLVAYFVLRAHDLLAHAGQTGLLATNTLAQGDTREVGLDQLTSAGMTIRQAIKGARWGSRSAAVDYCAVWTSRVPPSEAARRMLDGKPVSEISPSLDPVSRITGKPERLRANGGIVFQGSNILGLGFTMEPAEAAALREKDPRNADVLFPYLIGKDLNSRADSSASRWVINFHDWSPERAATYRDCFAQVERLVRAERAGNKRPARRDRWWLYAERAPELYKVIDKLERVIAITLVSKVVMPVMVPTGQVFAHKLGIFASDDPAMFGLLSSAPHYWWAISRSSTMKADLNYSPSDVFETFARPELSDELRDAGERLDSYRRELMLARQAGLTDTYNLVHDKSCRDADIAELRRLHAAIEEAVVAAYGWDLELDHDFYDTRQGVRYTVGPVVRQEMLDLLLELNQERHRAEVAAGAHAVKKPKRAAKPKVNPDQDAMF
ncbi:Eco57I restriction-modification methylase domain-containing protein [Pilimelia columellifera]|uniref:site-specific DNA-methyltransferase (adenine-specific) n=1 Tax=Pilimelia columellifera subsp. columellifera TaxID=706583 RepID=A0ABP6AT47_9ACTN